MKILRNISIIIILSVFGFSNGYTDGCDLPEYTFYLTDSGEVIYNSPEEINISNLRIRLIVRYNDDGILENKKIEQKSFTYH